MRWRSLTTLALAGVTVVVALFAEISASLYLDLLSGLCLVFMVAMLVVNGGYLAMHWKRSRWPEFIPLLLSLISFYAVFVALLHLGPMLYVSFFRSNSSEYQRIVDEIGSQEDLSIFGYTEVPSSHVWDQRWKLPADSRFLAPFGIAVQRRSNSVLAVKFSLHVGFGSERGYIYLSDSSVTRGVDDYAMFRPIPGQDDWHVFQD